MPETPAPPSCLTRSYSASNQRGGTLIFESVKDLDEHRRRLADPDGYRPQSCPSCGDHLHCHDFRARKLEGHVLEAFRRFACRGCSAIWQVLAGFMPRHLHRGWSRIEPAALPSSPPAETAVPQRTRRRWWRRLASSALLLIQALSVSAVSVAAAETRAELVRAMVRQDSLSQGRPLAELAGWIHRLVPGLRLL